MKVMLFDNYDRPGHAPIVIATNVSPEKANLIARLLNEEEERVVGEDTPNYYKAKDDDWEWFAW